jgi:fatty acid desaturase
MVAFTLVRRVLTPFSVPQAIAFVVCALCFYRSVLFTHELTHLRDKSFLTFRIAWNLLCGIPLLMPSFTYYSHVEHHMRRYYSTDHDGEYLPLATQSPWHILNYLAQPFWLPVVAVVRFLILSPISWVSPRFRDLIHQRASSMVMDPSYIRPLPTRKVLRIFRLQEGLCFAWSASVAVLLMGGWLPIGFLITVYCISVTILFLNALRTLGAHRYTNSGGEVTFLEQLLDSVNYPNHPVMSALWAPVGLRFHALHHLFPSLPYHNLAKAHKRLMAELPADSPYRLTESPSLTTALVQLWRTSQAASRRASRSRPSAGTPHVGGQPLTGAS